MASPPPPPPKSWLIPIGMRTPSQNELARKFSNRHLYAKLRKTLEQWVVLGMMNESVARATTRRRLTITRYARSKRFLLDRGNFVGGCKPLLDAATRHGLILDDKEEHLDDQYLQAVDPQKFLEIFVEDL